MHVEPDGASKLTRSEYETLCDVMLGLTDKAIAKRRNLSARGVQNRLAALFSKVLRGRHSWLRESASMDVYNLRTRLIFEVLRRGLIDSEALASLDNELDNWLTEQFGV
ncbi:response regulator transcription factor [Candidatus Obscuribacterales bacterium]|nr:response regulator transcription factor [Candidatus Obscuribacterales bacterium]